MILFILLIAGFACASTKENNIFHTVHFLSPNDIIIKIAVDDGKLSLGELRNLSIQNVDDVKMIKESVIVLEYA